MALIALGFLAGMRAMTSPLFTSQRYLYARTFALSDLALGDDLHIAADARSNDW
jgi:hypothetical protein